MSVQIVITFIISLIVGGGLGMLFFDLRSKKLSEQARNERDRLLKESQMQSREIILEAKNEANKVLESAKHDEQERRKSIEKIENHLVEREKLIEQKAEKIESLQEKLTEKAAEVKKQKEELETVEQKWTGELERVSKLSKEEAKDILLKHYEKEFEGDIIAHIKKQEQYLHDDADKKSKNILVQAIQRYASEVATESTTTIVELPNDEMKGRIIGKEGRNINAFELITGVDVIIDDTPGSILISGYDLVRRYIAKRSLEELVKDGRIQPSRIEEIVEKMTKEVNQLIKESGEKACYELGITDFHPDLMRIIGRLRFRTSYGQNILKHSVEVGFLASALASEVGVNVELAKRAGFLHDIGKAVDHEIEGSHAILGGKIARKFGLSEDLANAIESHHGEIEAKTPEAVIAASADAISGARPGARRESLEAYIKRLKELEEVANSFTGVKRSFAIQAGREVRVIVEPEILSDLQSLQLSKDIVNKIEKELTYPGEIKVTIIRETRVIEYAK